MAAHCAAACSQQFRIPGAIIIALTVNLDRPAAVLVRGDLDAGGHETGAAGNALGPLHGGLGIETRSTLSAFPHEAPKQSTNYKLELLYIEASPARNMGAKGGLRKTWL